MFPPWLSLQRRCVHFITKSLKDTYRRFDPDKNRVVSVSDCFIRSISIAPHGKSIDFGWCFFERDLPIIYGYPLPGLANDLISALLGW
jgi:hypothetical protein